MAILLPPDDGALAWRGVMVDTARHFMPISALRLLIGAMALLHLNVLHLHLSDDQGWRFESKKWPDLTAKAGHRPETLVGHSTSDGNQFPEHYLNKYDGIEHAGFYTQDELRELVTYASSNNITIVPEIDMPGHMRAARSAYPELGYNGLVFGPGRAWGVYHEVLRVDDKGLNFAKDILGELADVFPGPYIHIGGDEAPKDEWIAVSSARNAVKALGGNPDLITDYPKLQANFTRQLASVLSGYNRTLVGWDEIIDDGTLPGANSVVYAWRTETKPVQRATALQATTINAGRALYFDHMEGDYNAADEPLSIGVGSKLKDVYAYDPYEGLTDPTARALVQGMNAQLWTEYITDPDHLWHMMFPRLVAMADVAYYGDKREPFDQWFSKLPARIEEIKKIGVGSGPLPKY